MKKLILLVALSGSLTGIAQTTGGVPGVPTGTSNFPGSALGGAGSGTVNTSEQTTPSQAPGNNIQDMNLGVPRGTVVPMQRMEERTNYAGGSLGGETNINVPFVQPGVPETYAPDTPVAPSVPPASVELPRINGTTPKE